MKKFNKYIVNEFKSGFGRFIAIMAIVALGVGFLIGVLQATPDMKSTMSNYYLDNHAYDADVKATFGMTKEDVGRHRRARRRRRGRPAHLYRPRRNRRRDGRAVRLIGLDTDDLKEGDYLNDLTLLEGAWPDAPGEVLALHGSNRFDDVAVGDTFELDAASGTYQDVYAAETLTVVGVASSADYFYGDGREVTNVGSGVLDAVLVGCAQDLYDLQKSTIFSVLNNEGVMGNARRRPHRSSLHRRVGAVRGHGGARALYKRL